MNAYMTQVINRISGYTVYLLVNLSLILWACGMIIFHMPFYNRLMSDFFKLGELPITKYVMLFVALFGFFNLWWQKAQAFIILSYIYLFFWFYIPFGFLFNKTYNTSLMRSLAETILVAVLFYKIQRDKTLTN